MTDIVITAASVVAGSGVATEERTAGVTILAGQVIALDPATNKYVLADNNHATADIRQPRGISLHGASLNQPLEIQRSGDITIGATLVAGTDYWLSDTPGGISPRADIGSGEYVVLIGVAKSTTVLAIDIQYPGVSL